MARIPSERRDRMKCGCVVSREDPGMIRVCCHSVSGHDRDVRHEAWKWSQEQRAFVNTEDK